MTDLLVRTKNNFDFIRLFGSVAVVLSHSFPLVQKNSENPLNLITNNQVALFLIPIFFCISGYLIAKSACSSASLKHYLWKRLLRVQPLQILLALITVFFIGAICTRLSLTDYFSNKHTWSYFINVFPVFGIQYELPGVFENNLHPNIVNGSLWTLVDEERLYILMGVLCLRWKHRKLFFIAMVIVSNILWMGNYFDLFNLRYFSNANVVYQLVFLNSAFVFLLNINFSRIATKPFLSLGIILLFWVALYLPFSEVWVILFAPLSILAFAHLKCFLNYAGKWGDFSSAIYMFSFPTQQILSNSFYFQQHPYMLFLVTMAIVFPISILSWHFVEKKILSYKNLVK